MSTAFVDKKGVKKMRAESRPITCPANTVSNPITQGRCLESPTRPVQRRWGRAEQPLKKPEKPRLAVLNLLSAP